MRIGIHTGHAAPDAEGYVGHDVHLGARIAAAGHGGQVLLSKETRELVDVAATDLGEHRLKDFDEPVSIFQLGERALPAAQDDLEHEPAAPGELVRRQGRARSRRSSRCSRTAPGC